MRFAGDSDRIGKMTVDPRVARASLLVAGIGIGVCVSVLLAHGPASDLPAIPDLDPQRRPDAGRPISQEGFVRLDQPEPGSSVSLEAEPAPRGAPPASQHENDSEPATMAREIASALRSEIAVDDSERKALEESPVEGWTVALCEHIPAVDRALAERFARALLSTYAAYLRRHEAEVKAIAAEIHSDLDAVRGQSERLRAANAAVNDWYSREVARIASEFTESALSDEQAEVFRKLPVRFPNGVSGYLRPWLTPNE